MAIDLSSSTNLLHQINFPIFTCYLKSRGWVKLASSNPDVNPLIQPNFLTAQEDVVNLGLALNQSLAAFFDMGLALTVDPCASADCSTPLKLANAYLNNPNITFAPGYHPTGTAGLGNAIDPKTMEVYGTTGLYVMDGSALVRTPGQNTQNSIYALAEHGVELLIAQRESQGVWN